MSTPTKKKLVSALGIFEPYMKFDKKQQDMLDWQAGPVKTLSSIFQKALLTQGDDLSLREVRREYQERASRSYGKFGFETFLEFILQLGTTEYSIPTDLSDWTPRNGSIWHFDEGELNKWCQSEYLMESIVKKTAQLVQNSEKNNKDLKISEFVKEYRKFHKEDLPLEAFPRYEYLKISPFRNFQFRRLDVSSFIDELVKYSMSEGKNPLLKDADLGVLRIKPKAKAKMQIGFGLTPDRLRIHLKSRFRPAAALPTGELIEVNITGNGSPLLSSNALVPLIFTRMLAKLCQDKGSSRCPNFLILTI